MSRSGGLLQFDTQMFQGSAVMLEKKPDMGIRWSTAQSGVSPDLLAEAPPVNRIKHPIDYVAGELAQSLSQVPELSQFLGRQS